MRKQVFGRQLKRDKNERKALFSGLISAMVLRGRIKTTEAKAKAIKSQLEKLVTKAKKEEKIARKLLQSHLKPFEVDKMVTQIGPGFKNRAGGYTSIIKIGTRLSDNASMVIMQWSKMEAVLSEPKTKPESKSPSKTASSGLTKSVRKTSKPRSARATRGKKEEK